MSQKKGPSTKTKCEPQSIARLGDGLFLFKGKKNMTKNEFYSEYKRLYERWPQKYMTDDPRKLKELFELCESLNVSFMRSFVNRALRTNDESLDLRKAIIGELKSQNRLNETYKILSQGEEINTQALDNYLQELGVNSLVDAVFKRSE